MVAFSQDGNKVFPVPLAYPIFERENSVLGFDEQKLESQYFNALVWGVRLQKNILKKVKNYLSQ